MGGLFSVFEVSEVKPLLTAFRDALGTCPLAVNAARSF